MEMAAACVAGLLGSQGSHAGTPGKWLRSLFGRSKRRAGIGVRNVLVLTPSSVRIYACKARGARPVATHEVAQWARHGVVIEAVTGEQFSAFNVNESGSETNRFYVLTFTPRDGGEPVVVECARSDSARATILALEDATGSPPSKITSRRRRKT
jgi:hypothetical protein